MTPLAAFGLLLVAAALAGLPLARAIRRRDTTITDLLRVNAQAAGDLLEYAGDLAEADRHHAREIAAKDRTIAIGDRACESFAAKLLLARAERDTARTALQAVQEKEARDGLLNPDEPVGEASVIEFPARGAR